MSNATIIFLLTLCIMILICMENCGFSKKDIRRVVGQLYEIFDLNSVEDAKEKYLSSPC